MLNNAILIYDFYKLQRPQIYMSMSIKKCLIQSLVTLILFPVILTSCSEDQPPPNIVLILCDDMGFSDPGCYGGEIETPNIDRLAMDGVRMTRVYNSARCCPSRASLFTGLYPHQAGIGYFANFDKGAPGYTGFLQDRSVGISDVLSSAGYNTYMSGKWHMGDNPGPMEKGFEEFYGFTVPHSISCWDQDAMFRLPEGRPLKNYPEGEFYSTDAITDYALDFLEDGINKPEPFFLFLSYNAPHFPLHAPKEITDKYASVYEKGWDAIRAERFEKQQELGIGEPEWELPPRSEVMVERRDMGYGGKPNPAWDGFSEDRQHDLARRMAVYAAMVDRMDQNIGRVIRSLEESGELENTLIIFLSDNGACAEFNPLGFDIESSRDNILNTGDRLDSLGLPGTYISYGSGWAMTCNTPLNLYKHYIHEGGISTPFIMHWPDGIAKPGTIDKRPAHIMDVMATCVEVSGAEYPSMNNGTQVLPMEGMSMVPVLDGVEGGQRILGFEHERNRGYLKGEWKIVSEEYRGAEWELYNIEEDRLEQNNLAEQYPEKVKELESEYQAWAERVLVLPYFETMDDIYTKH
jgi:arylsulfatase A-like enzyme